MNLESKQASGERPVPADILPPGETHTKFLEALHELGAVLWEMDAQTWRFTFVSERAERVFGYPVKDWYEDPTFWQDRLLHPEDREWCVGFCTLASAECRDHAFLYRARTADHRTIWVKDVVRVIPDASGKPGLMRGVMADVTDELGDVAPMHSTHLDYNAPELARYRDVLAA